MSGRADWLKARRTGVGGSDVAPILGLSKWTTPLAVYLDKRGEATETPDNDAMRWGRYLEPAVRQAYADETGREVRVPGEMLRHPLYEHMIANLDGVAGGGNHGPLRIFEAKTARSAEGWGEPGTDQIPQAYCLQIQHYMEVTGIMVADVAVLIGGSDFRIYEVPADRELQDMIIDAEADFWRRVQRGEPPEPVTFADAQARYGRGSVPETVVLPEDLAPSVDRLRSVLAQSKAIESEIESLKAQLMITMGDRDTLIDSAGRTLATWKVAKAPQRFDAAAFKAVHPELAAAFTKAGDPSRRFLLKP